MVDEAEEPPKVVKIKPPEIKPDENIIKGLIAKYQESLPTKDTTVVLALQKFAKDILKKDMKYAHNSIYNPVYPKPKEEDNRHKVRFTVVGNRVTKEFIYCMQIVSGLYKYRPKIFKPPNITGVTGVEWPDMSRLIRERYGGLAFCTEGQVAVIIEDTYVGGVKELQELIEKKFLYHLRPDYYQLSVAEFKKFITVPKRPSAYMHISIDGKHSGTFLFMLYADLVPRTCENFLRLCCLKKGGYRGSPIHRVVKEGWVQCGGIGLKETDLNCENFIVAHDRRGVLSMANDGRNKDCSTQFFILLHPAPWMDDKYVAFGQLIDGGKLLDTIEEIPTFYEAPLSEIKIMDAGVFNMECLGIHVSKDTREFIDSHIENLNELEKWLAQLIMDAAWLGVKNPKKSVSSVASVIGEGEQSTESESGSGKDGRKKVTIKDQDNLEEQMFHDWQPEEYALKQMPQVSEVDLPMLPFFIPLTDVPYPGEISSEYDLKKFIRGDYCLEADVTAGVDPMNLKGVTRSKTKYESQSRMKIGGESNTESDTESELEDKSNLIVLNKGKFVEPISKIQFKFDDSMIGIDDNHIEPRISSFEGEPFASLAADEEVKEYIDTYGDFVSFAGEKISHIAKMKKDKPAKEVKNLWPRVKQTSTLSPWPFTEYEESPENIPKYIHHNHPNVVILEPTSDHDHARVLRRRQTGIPGEFTLNVDDDEDMDDDNFEGSIDDHVDENKDWYMHDIKEKEPRKSSVPGAKPKDDQRRSSVLDRLYDDVKEKIKDSGEEPTYTLKHYKPMTSEIIRKNLLLTGFSSSRLLRGYHSDTPKSRFITYEQPKPASFENLLKMYHDNKLARRYSSDYLQVFDQLEHKEEASIRCTEYAKRRPYLSVKEYQQMNKDAEIKRAKSKKQVPKSKASKLKN